MACVETDAPQADALPGIDALTAGTAHLMTAWAGPRPQAIDRVCDDNAAFEGNTPSNAPRWQVAGHAKYRLPELAGLELNAGLRYFGASCVSDDNRLSVPGRTVVNAGLSHDFRLQTQDWTLFANLNNVFNRKYWASGGWSSGNVGEARNLSLTLRTQF